MKILKQLKSGILIAIILGGILAIISYTTLVNRAYNNLKEEIKNAPAFTGTIVQDPAYSGVLVFPNRQSGNDEKQNTLWRILVNMNVLEWDKSTEDIGGILSNSFNKSLSEGTVNLGKTNGVNFLMTFLRKIGHDAIKGDSLYLKDVIAGCLAEEKGAIDKYDNLLIQSSDVSLDDLKKLKSGDTKTDVINRIFLHYHVGNQFDEIPQFVEGGKIDAVEEYRQIKEFTQNLVLNILETPRVADAKNWLVTIKGYEQFVMIIIFFCALLLLIQRALQENKRLVAESSKDLVNFRDKIIQWLIVTLPAIGFIGTIRGLSWALGDADSIVRAGSQVQSSIAIGDVTNVLKIAFTTTLIALILVIVLELVKLLLSYFIKEDV